MTETANNSASSTHRWFLLGLLYQSFLGALQLIGGVGLLLAPAGAINHFVTMLIQAELADDRTDPLALWVQNIAATLPLQTDNFYWVYLVGHGILNLGMALALLARIVWAYPVALCVLVAFVGYQTVRYFESGGVLLLVLTAIDVLVIWVIWREYRAVRADHHR